MANDKHFTVKIFDSDGSSFLKSVDGGSGGLKNIPTFTSKINGGLGELVLDFGFPFDDFDEGTIIAFMNVVDLYVDDSSNPRGRRVYRGFISKYEPYIEPDGNEGVRVTCLGLVSLLTLSYYKNGTAYTVTHTSQDPQDIFKAIINHRNTIYTDALLSYTGVTSTVGTAVSITFTDQKWSDAVKKTNQLAGTDWWWKVDADGLCHFKAKPSSATHRFTIEKDIERLSTPKTSEKIINAVQVRGSSANTDGSDATSQTAYGVRTSIVSDSSLTDSNALTQRSAKTIADNKDPKITSPFTVNANYDIESIKVGDTCLIQNQNKDSVFYSTNMLIVSVTYEGGDRVMVEVEQIGNSFGSELSSLISSQTTSSSGSGSSTGFVDRETPSGTVNGSNVTFTLAHTPVAGSDHLWLDGVLQTYTTDYSISGTTITFTSAPLTGSVPVISYRTSNGSSTFSDRETPSGSVNGSNVTFTLAHTPTTGSEYVWMDGVLQTVTTDYTISGGTITFITAPLTGAVIVVSYRY